MPDITDFFGKASLDTDYAIATTVSATRSAGASVLEAVDVSKFADDTPVFIVTYKKEIDPVTGEATVVDLRSFKALVNVGANTFTNLTIAPGYVDDIGNDEDDFIEAIPTSYWGNQLVEGLLTSLNPDGTLKLANGGAIFDGNGNELIKASQTASAVNEITVANAATGNAPAISATGGDTNVDLELTPKGTGGLTKNGNPVDWWEEIGRTTLTSAGDVITVSGLPARKYLMIIVACLDTGGGINCLATFNSDTGSNYSFRNSVSGAADTTSTSASNVVLSFSTGNYPQFGFFEVLNIATSEKIVQGMSSTSGTAGAANLPGRKELAGKWANTSDQITRIDVTNSSTGDYAIGSEVIVLGHD